MTNLTDKKIVSNQINQIESWISVDVVLGSEKEFVVTEAWTHGPGHGAVYQWKEPSVIPLSYSGAPVEQFINITYKTLFDVVKLFTCH